jgi:chaperonin GroES
MAELSIQPIGERVLVQPFEAENVTAGGIILPDSAKEKPQQAKVLAIGGAVQEEAIKVGKNVMYRKFAGTEIENGGETYLILELADVLATF